MLKTVVRSIGIAAATFAVAGVAHAACDVDKPRAEMTHEDAQAVYECLKDDLYAGYQKGPKRWIPAEFVKNYRDWEPASTLPADPGFHGARYLLTFVNDIGWDEYTQFKEEDVEIPAGTVIAKESFEVTDEGKVRKGPLFFMQKVAEGTSPKTNDWYYMMVTPNGTPAAVNVYRACSDCHMGFAYKDNLGYPEPDVRVSR